MILRIREAQVCGPHSLRLAFNDGTTRQIDVRPLLDGPIFEPLHDPTCFAKVTVDPVCGTVVWPNGAGYRVLPLLMEFWHDRPFRLHDRIEFRRETTSGSWVKTRLYP